MTIKILQALQTVAEAEAAPLAYRQTLGTHLSGQIAFHLFVLLLCDFSASERRSCGNAAPSALTSMTVSDSLCGFR